MWSSGECIRTRRDKPEGFFQRQLFVVQKSTWYLSCALRDRSGMKVMSDANLGDSTNKFSHSAPIYIACSVPFISTVHTEHQQQHNTKLLPIHGLCLDFIFYFIIRLLIGERVLVKEEELHNKM